MTEQIEKVFNLLNPNLSNGGFISEEEVSHKCSHYREEVLSNGEKMGFCDKETTEYDFTNCDVNCKLWKK